VIGQSLFSWRVVDVSAYLPRFWTYIFVYWITYLSTEYFAVCFGREARDVALILGGSTIHVVLSGSITWLFKPKHLAGFASIAVVCTTLFRAVELLPHFAATDPDAVRRVAMLHGCLALCSAIVAFYAVVFLFRERSVST